jgi:hypothetical protein
MKPAILALATFCAAFAVMLALAAAAPATAALDFVVGDEVGDTFGTEGSVQHDILTVSGLTSDGNFSMTIAFAGPIEPPDSGGPNALNGFILFDTDQDAATGINVDDDIAQFCPAPLGIGQDVGLTLFDYTSEGAALYSSTGFGDPQVDLGRIPIDFIDQSITFTIPLDLLGGDELFNVSVVVGSFVGPPKGKIPESDPTDCAPGDGGFIDTAGLLATPVPTATVTSEPAAATPPAAVDELPPAGVGGSSGRNLPRVALWASLGLAGLTLAAAGWRMARSR